MTAFVAKESHSSINPEDGYPINIPKGARLEEGHPLLDLAPELWEPEADTKDFFSPRKAQGLTVLNQGPGLEPLTIDLATGQAPVGAEVEAVAKAAAEKIADAAPEPKSAPAPTTGVKRSLPKK